MLSLRQLRYFEALSRHLHFGRAAEACAVTQPALSMQIREMEQAYGVSLVERGRHGVRLTPLGDEVAARARTVLSALGDMELALRGHGRLLEGRLRLGVIASVAPYLLPRFLPRLQEVHPGVEVSLRESLTEHLVDALVDGELDIAIMSLPLEHPDLDSVELFEDPFFLALPPDATVAPSEPVSPEAVCAADLLLLEDGHCLRDQALQLCRKVDARQLRRFGASSLSTLAELVANGQGVTLLPGLFVETERGLAARLRLLRFREPQPSRTLGLFWRRTLPFPEDIKALTDLIRQCRVQVETPE
ncbi:LysR substrate-binding domain-containing protein [Xanthobacter sp. TB0139]|uniref:LysR substrate-binding domain-containing protein n=1 Tax=Xanthobacter sp. TB0139 TaxID=3459178 RepID=UPI004039C301